MGRTKHDLVWKHFDIVPDPNDNEDSSVSEKVRKKVAKCRYCGAIYSASNVTRLAIHLAEKCKKCPVSTKQSYLANKNDSVDAAAAIDVMSSEEEELGQNRNAHDMSGSNKTPDPLPSTSTSTSSKQGQEVQNKVKTKLKTLSLIPFTDRISEDEIKRIHRALARAVYSSGCPLGLFENEYWQIAFKLLRPALNCLPSRYMLSTPLLDEEYSEMLTENEKKFKEASTLALMTDGWTNICGDGLVNFIVTTPEPIFYKAIDKKTERETSEYIGNECCSVISEVGSEKFLLLVTDSAANMKGAWKIVEEKYPHVSAVPCAGHIFQNLIKDLMDVPSLSDLTQVCKKIGKHIKKSHVRLAAFKEIQQRICSQSKINAVSIKLPPTTRFGYVVIMFHSLLSNKEALEATVICNNLGILRKVRKRVLSDTFWTKVKVAYDLLKPAADSITQLEGNSAILSQVVEMFHIVKNTFEEFSNKEECDLPISLSDISTILKAFKRRYNLCVKPIHLACNLLDPRYRGEKLTDTEVFTAYGFIEKQAENLNLNVSSDDILENIGQFRDKTGFFVHDTLWKAAKNHKPSSWWRGLCRQQPVSAVASRLMELPPTSAACERNWSDFSFIHSKSRNRLKTGRVVKIVAVRSNLNFNKKITKTKKPKKNCDLGSSDFDLGDENHSDSDSDGDCSGSHSDDSGNSSHPHASDSDESLSETD